MIALVAGVEVAMLLGWDENGRQEGFEAEVSGLESQSTHFKLYIMPLISEVILFLCLSVSSTLKKDPSSVALTEVSPFLSALSFSLSTSRVKG